MYRASPSCCPVCLVDPLTTTECWYVMLLMKRRVIEAAGGVAGSSRVAGRGWCSEGGWTVGRTTAVEEQLCSKGTARLRCAMHLLCSFHPAVRCLSVKRIVRKGGFSGAAAAVGMTCLHDCCAHGAVARALMSMLLLLLLLLRGLG